MVISAMDELLIHPFSHYIPKLLKIETILKLIYSENASKNFMYRSLLEYDREAFSFLYITENKCILYSQNDPPQTVRFRISQKFSNGHGTIIRLIKLYKKQNIYLIDDIYYYKGKNLQRKYLTERMMYIDDILDNICEDVVFNQINIHGKSEYKSLHTLFEETDKKSFVITPMSIDRSRFIYTIPSKNVLGKYMPQKSTIKKENDLTFESIENKMANISLHEKELSEIYNVTIDNKPNGYLYIKTIDEAIYLYNLFYGSDTDIKNKNRSYELECKFNDNFEGWEMC